MRVDPIACSHDFFGVSPPPLYLRPLLPSSEERGRLMAARKQLGRRGGIEQNCPETGNPQILKSFETAQIAMGNQGTREHDNSTMFSSRLALTFEVLNDVSELSIETPPVRLDQKNTRFPSSSCAFTLDNTIGLWSALETGFDLVHFLCL